MGEGGGGVWSWDVGGIRDGDIWNWLGWREDGNGVNGENEEGLSGCEREDLCLKEGIEGVFACIGVGVRGKGSGEHGWAWEESMLERGHWRGFLLP